MRRLERRERGIEATRQISYLAPLEMRASKAKMEEVLLSKTGKSVQFWLRR